jgi:hypothetical protein
LHGNDKISSGETEQNQDENLASPTCKQVLKQSNRTLACIGSCCNFGVDGHRAENRHQYQNSGCRHGERTCSQERNSWLVTDGRKVINAGKPEYEIPRMGVIGGLGNIEWRAAEQERVERITPARLCFRKLD